jgi:glycosyltransferase involved in cell wall biosynthesis
LFKKYLYDFNIMNNEKQMDLSVVIPCYNGKATIEETLDALVKQKFDGAWEIILADNGSTDFSVEIFQKIADAHPEIPMCVVDASQRKGQPHALNTGVKAALGRAIVFCDADDVVAPGWLSAMANALKKHDFVAARMDFYKLNKGWVCQYRINAQEKELPKIDYPPYFYHAGGGTIGFRKSVFEKIGEFDQSLPILHDTDFCFRAQLAGFKIHYVPKALIYIRLRSDLHAIFWQAYNYARYNVTLSKRYKNYGPAAKGRIKRFIAGWISIIKTCFNPGYDIMASEAVLRWSLGWQVGLFVGALENRLPPP